MYILTLLHMDALLCIDVVHVKVSMGENMSTTTQPGDMLKKYRHLSSLTELSTGVVPSVHLDSRLEQARPKNTRILYSLPPLPFFLDSSGRTCLQIINPYEETGPLALAMVWRYLEVIKTYPGEIVLSQERYWTAGKMAGYLEIPQLYIKLPYVYVETLGESFDIMIRGDVGCQNF